jgi:hypothetical protein
VSWNVRLSFPFPGRDFVPKSMLGDSESMNIDPVDPDLDVTMIVPKKDKGKQPMVRPQQDLKVPDNLPYLHSKQQMG